MPRPDALRCPCQRLLQVTGIIQDELKEKLENQEYNVDKAPKLAKEITDSIKKKLKGCAPARCTLRAARPLLQSPHATSAMCTHAAVAEADLGWERYKFVVQTVVGEQRGEGIK